MNYLLCLTLLLAPTYAIRFNLFGLPTNLLMVWLFVLWIVFAIWLVWQEKFLDFCKWIYSEARTVHFILAALFLLSGVFSLFVGAVTQEKVGQFIVLFLQPIGTYVMARYLLVKDKGLKIKDKSLFVYTALLFVAVAGLYAIVQYFTLIGIPPAWWGNANEPKRALSFFLHPNFYALFVTPLLAFLLPVVGSQLSVVSRHAKLTTHSLLTIVFWLLGAAGLFFSLSRGGWLGLAAAIGVYLLVAGSKKLLKFALATVMVIVIVTLSVPNFRYRLLLPFQGEKSSVARFSLWHTGWKMIQDSPIEGKGLRGFANNWCVYNTDPNLQAYPGPHNIILNFWVDTGLLGVLSFLGLVLLALWRGVKHKRNPYQLGLALACIALVVHGLVDIPYLKNDLALLFWLLFSFISYQSTD